MKRGIVDLDASRVVPVDKEIRPVAISLLPLIGY